jgi:hypothetical protein
MSRSTLVRGVVATVFAAALTAGLAPVASADNATLGPGCSGGWFAFTLTANGDIPAGSTWTSRYTAASSFQGDYEVYSDSPAISSTQVNAHTASITSTAVIPSGTVVTLSPSGYTLTNKSLLTLSITGYGGSYSASFDTDSDWPTC